MLILLGISAILYGIYILLTKKTFPIKKYSFIKESKTIFS